VQNLVQYKQRSAAAAQRQRARSQQRPGRTDFFPQSNSSLPSPRRSCRLDQFGGFYVENQLGMQ
jgi:hypothetical protein